ncbi:MAG: FHA domain-containing protein [Coriobacteriia bacterium]
MTFWEFAIDKAGLDILVTQVMQYGWVYEFGMFLFLIVAASASAWIFIDSSNKRKADKALLPRIMSLVGVFFILPAFIFRYTGNANGVTLRVRLLGEPGSPFYEGPIGWNVKWLMAGYGPKIALLAMLGMAVSILAAIIYAATVSRQRPSTEFVSALNNQFGELRQEIQSVKSRPVSTGVPTAMPGGMSAPTAIPETRRAAATVIERPGAGAATILERPGSGAELRVVSGTSAGRVFKLPASDAKIGRDTANVAAIEDAKVSREHAKVRFADGVYSIVDLGSGNGTFVNDRQISGQTPLSDGDLVRVGDTTLMFKPAGA